MKSSEIIITAAFFLLIGIASPANAKQEKQKENTAPAEQEQQAKPEKQQEAQAPKQQQQHQQEAQAPKQQQQHQQQQAQAPKQQQHQQEAQAPKQQQQHQQQQAGQQQDRSSHAPQRTQQAVERQRAQPELRLSARGSGRIPDERFRSNFGHQHSFHMGNPVLVGGYSRFQYSGFWFGFVEPWPTGWYYTDDVYIDYVDGGYYMYDPYYPGARFAISVVI
jgi:flagellar motor protein MotB